MFIYDWKQQAQRLKLQETTNTINKEILFGETFTDTIIFIHEEKD